VAVGDGRWLAAWVVSSRGADTDLAYVVDGDRAAGGTLSRFESSANHPSPFFGPDAAAAWAERGAEGRVLVSGYRDSPERRYLTRLQTEPGRLVFIGLAAAALGVVTLPIMPWIFVSALVAFYVTNRFIRTRLIGALARLSALLGRSGDKTVARARLESVPPIAWAGAFAVGEVAVLVALLPSVGATVTLSFARPLVLRVAAGMALRGYRPILEIMFGDFIALGFDQIVNGIGKFRQMFDDRVRVPLVVREPIGMWRSSAAQHSQSLEAWYAHIPGLVVVTPTTPADNSALRKGASRCDGPVVYMGREDLWGLRGEVTKRDVGEMGRARCSERPPLFTVVYCVPSVHRKLKATCCALSNANHSSSTH
jgi:hypothetical protein